MAKYDDPQEQRIFDILGTDDLEVNEENVEKYLNFFTKNLKKSVLLTGIEDFPWEELYVLGPGSKKKYEKLKKKNPSYTDTFVLIEFDGFKVPVGIFVKVKRKSDDKEFSLPLADLKAVDKKSINYKILDDYSVWIVNY